MNQRKWPLRLLLSAVGLLAALLGVWGCWATASRPLDVGQLGTINRVETSNGGLPAEARTVGDDSAEARAVQQWLRSHPTGWQRSVVNYVPSRRVSGPNFTLNFTGRLCVLNYRASGSDDWVQVTRPLADGETIPDVFDSK